MRIVVAIDGSEHSVHTLSTVRASRWPPESTVRVLNAVVYGVPPPPAPAWSGETIGFKGYSDLVKGEAEKLVTRAADGLRRDGLAVESVVRVGDPGKIIVDEAEQWPADLIVLGSRGLSGLRRLFLGSVAQYVVAHAPCSVQVVREKKPAAAPKAA